MFRDCTTYNANSSGKSFSRLLASSIANQLVIKIFDCHHCVEQFYLPCTYVEREPSNLESKQQKKIQEANTNTINLKTTLTIIGQRAATNQLINKTQ